MASTSPVVVCVVRLMVLGGCESNNTKASLSGRVMGTVIKSATSAFQYDDPVTPNAQGHGHSFIDRMQHLNIAYVVIKCGMKLCSLLINKIRLHFINIRMIIKCAYIKMITYSC
jgi:hypothetical protein